MPPALVIAAFASSAAWIGLLARVRFRGNRHTAPSGPTPAAVAALLEASGRERNPDVLNAAILELAGRGVLEVIPADSQGPAMIRAAAVPRRSELPPYQASVVARVLARQGPNGRPLPLTALESEEDQAARTWFGGFDRLVRREAVELRLLQRPVRRIVRLGMIYLLVAMFSVPLVAVPLPTLGRLVIRRRLPRRSVIRGQVAKIWSSKKDFRNGLPAQGFFDCTLDTGGAPESVRIVVPARSMGDLQVGDIVEVLVDPRTRVVKDLRMFGPDPLL